MLGDCQFFADVIIRPSWNNFVKHPGKGSLAYNAWLFSLLLLLLLLLLLFIYVSYHLFIYFFKSFFILSYFLLIYVIFIKIFYVASQELFSCQHTRPLVKWVECSPMTRETTIRSRVESH